MTFDEIYALCQRLTAQEADRLSGAEDACANLHITGSSSGTIGIKLTGGELFLQNSAHPTCDAEVTVSSDDLNDIMSGRLNPMLAVMTGRIRVSGNASKLMRIISLLRK